MRHDRAAFAGWPGRARAVAPELLKTRDAQVARQFDFLLRVFTPRTVFLDIGSSDCELSLRAAGYVERVWCVEALARPECAPCNLRCGGMGGVPLASVDVAFSEVYPDARDVLRLLAPGGVWFMQGKPVAARMLHGAGFARVRYFAGALRLPWALAHLPRAVVTAGYK